MTHTDDPLIMNGAAVLSLPPKQTTRTGSAVGVSLAYSSLPPDLAIQQKPGTEEYRITARTEISRDTIYGPVVAPSCLVTTNQPPTSVFGRFTTESLETLVFDSDETCNWMKFVRLSRNTSANMEASRSMLTGEIFFYVTKNIPPNSELVVALTKNYCDALTRCTESLSQKWAREGAWTGRANHFAASPSDAALIRSVGNELKRLGYSATMLCERVLQLDHTAWDPMDKLLQRFLAASGRLTLYLSSLEFGLLDALRNFWNVPTPTRTALFLTPGGIAGSLLPVALKYSSDIFVVSQLKPDRLSDYLQYVASASTDNSVIRRSDQADPAPSTSKLPSVDVMITSAVISSDPLNSVFFLHVPLVPVQEFRSLEGRVAKEVQPAATRKSPRQPVSIDAGGTSSATVVEGNQHGNETVSTVAFGGQFSSSSVAPLPGQKGAGRNLRKIPDKPAVPGSWNVTSRHRYPLRAVSTPSTPSIDSINAVIQPAASTDSPATSHPSAAKPKRGSGRPKPVASQPDKSPEETPETGNRDLDLNEEVTEGAEDLDLTLEDVLAAEDEEEPHSTAYREYMAQCMEVYRDTYGDVLEDAAARDVWLSEQRATYARLWLEHRRAAVGGTQHVPTVAENATDESEQAKTEAPVHVTAVEDYGFEVGHMVFGQPDMDLNDDDVDAHMVHDEPPVGPQVSPREARKLRREQIKEHRNLVKEQRRRAKQPVSAESSGATRALSSPRDGQRSVSEEYAPPTKQTSKRVEPTVKPGISWPEKTVHETEPPILNNAASDSGSAPEPDLAALSVDIPVGEFGPADVSTEITATRVLRKTNTWGSKPFLAPEERLRRERVYKLKYKRMCSLRRRGLPYDDAAIAEYYGKKLKRTGTEQSKNPVESTTFYCSVCGHAVKSRRALRLHMKKRHDQQLRDQPVSLFPFEHPCDACELKFLTEAALSSHKRLKHPVNGVRHMFECLVCLQVYSNALQLGMHRKTHMDADGRLPCRFCPDKWFRDLSSAGYHIRSQHGEEDQQERAYRGATEGDVPVALPHQCHVCHVYCISKNSMRRHLRTFHKELYPEMGASLPGAGPLMCDICQMTFKNAAALANHRKAAHRPPGEALWPCRICSQDCGDAKRLHDHLKSHMVNNLIVCPVCFVSFPLRNFSDHMRHKHPRRDGRETCDVCGKQLANSMNMEEHKARQHGLGINKRSCQACGELIRKDFILKKHYAAKHPGLTPAYTPGNADFQFKCPSCPGEFTSAVKLAQHQRRDHGVKQDKIPRRKPKKEILDDTSEEEYESLSDESS